MMKKIISLLLTMLLVLVPTAIAVAVETVNMVDIKVSTIVYTVDVSVKTNSIDDGLTLKIYPLVENEQTGEYSIQNAAAPIHLSECTVCTQEQVTETVIGEDGEAEEVTQNIYTYNFDSFNLLKTTPTGVYRAVINNTYTKDFEFANKTGKVSIYEDIANATALTMESVIARGKEERTLDLDVGNYFSYPQNVKDSINNCLEELELTAWTEGEDPTDEQLREFESMLKSEMERLLAIAELATASTPQRFDKLAKENDMAFEPAVNNMGLDLKYYKDKKRDIDPALMQNYMKGLEPYSYEKEEVQKVFDVACLLTLIKTDGAGNVTEALTYYNEKGVIALDTSLTVDFTDVQKNNVSLIMQQSTTPLQTKQDIEGAYAAAAVIVANGEPISPPAPNPPPRQEGAFGPAGVKVPVNNIEEVQFSDLETASWATEAIKFLASEGVISGKGDGKFYPNDTVTREEFVKIIVEAFKIYNKNVNAEFDDVAYDRWSYSYVASAVHAGIINGVSGTEFNPAGTMSRQDMAVIMYRVAKLFELGTGSMGATFADNNDVAPYAKDAVRALTGAGIINGTGNNCFSPKGTVTRAQAAKIVYEMMNAVGGAK